MNNDRKNNIEVEIRALAKDADDLKKKVENAGGKLVSTNTLHDIYFCNKNFSTIEEAEMHEVGSYSVRLRQFSKNGKTVTNLNTKTITKTGDHNAWEEHETEVSDFKEMAKILSITEFKPFFQLEKTRTEYSLGEMSVFAENIKDFGGCIEVEILTIPGNEDASKKKIMDFLSSIGITQESIVPKSITNIVMKQRAFKVTVNL